MSESNQELKAELERLRIENATLKCAATVGITMKISNKGALSVDGIGALSGDSVRGAVALGVGHV